MSAFTQQGSVPREILERGTLVDILNRRANSNSDQIAYTFLANRGRTEENMTYRQLHDQAAKVAGLLSDKGSPGDRIILFFPPGLDYIVSFLGCLMAGQVAVPLYPPRPNQKRDRIDKVIRDCSAALALTNDRLLPVIESFMESGDDKTPLSLYATDHLSDTLSDGFRSVTVTRDDLAFL